MDAMCSMKHKFIEYKWLWPVGVPELRKVMDAEWSVLRMPDGEDKYVDLVVRPPLGAPGCLVRWALDGTLVGGADKQNAMEADVEDEKDEDIALDEDVELDRELGWWEPGWWERNWEMTATEPGKKGSKLVSQVPAAEFVLETLGNARTLFKPCCLAVQFAWLNEHINQRLCRDDFNTFIAGRNSLDQFCVNFVNERLLNFIQSKLFENRVVEYNKQARRPHPYHGRPGPPHAEEEQAYDGRGVHEAVGQPVIVQDGLHRPGCPTFAVNHFTGPVAYSSENSLEHNLEALNPDFVSLLRSTSAGEGPPADGSGSSNPFVRSLYSGKAIGAQAHPRNEDTILSAQQPVKPKRAPSVRGKGTVKRMPTEPLGTAVQASGPPCVAGEFRSALDTLFETLEEMRSWYVFCVNPNDSQLPNQLEARSVKGQSPYEGGYNDPFGQSNQQLPLVQNTSPSPFQRGDMYDDFDERKSLRCLLAWVGRRKRPDIQQARREKLALNMLIWFVCGCVVFVIIIFDAFVEEQPELRGDVFNLTEAAVMHLTVVPVVAEKSDLNYGVAPDDLSTLLTLSV
ncbi:P-loop containing nucleoside triphosphate hydrolase protein [Fomitopsis serialis]|uniref:P-loop containing nucleoside triphosphate hydrolase protein n=1 Tax=Fomitopsis serialis TaxID=139415 RepID=UPI0020078DCB|nr:P-loop containing nucleoside triphosphate hydrolase protein [Neoantrodia serialis]KAH9913588.1 P-loop containing nucleoside triphosphate hydrolase protein [Neoantrodia serialis]